MLLLSIISACCALHILRKKTGFLLAVSDNTHFGGLIAPILLPLFFVGAWAWILIL